METKKCKHCGQELPVSEFFRKASAKDGMQSWCKQCMHEESKDAQKKYIAKQRSLGLEAYTPRELMKELHKRGYVGKLEYTRTEIIDISKLDD